MMIIPRKIKTPIISKFASAIEIAAPVNIAMTRIANKNAIQLNLFSIKSPLISTYKYTVKKLISKTLLLLVGQAFILRENEHFVKQKDEY